MDNARQQRGLVIAAMFRLTQHGEVWQVPSQTGENRKYKVDPKAQTCTCPDHQDAGHKCKHIFAVEFVIQRELFPDGTEIVTQSVTVTDTVRRKTYRQDWPRYNESQVNEKEHFLALLHDLCRDLPDQPQKMGRPRLRMSDAVFAACFKVYSTVSGRRFMSDLRGAKEKGYVTHIPHFNSVFNALENPAVTAVLQAFVERTALPLKAVESNFAVDSTGFTTSRFHRWFDHKYGKVREEHDWVKAHWICGVHTNVIAAVEIHERNTNDSPILPSLLNSAAKNFDVAEVSADKQYASESNFRAIAECGATAYISFRAGITGACGGYFGKAYHYFSFNREAFLTRYHQRSNVETSVMMVKSKFGDAVRSKSDVAMRNEVLAKVVCHNICCLISAMYELGVSPELGCTKTVAAAQKVELN